jgi:hypothetical protein
MKKLLSGICAAAMTLSLGAAVPAVAAPLPVAQAPQHLETNRVFDLQRVFHRGERHYRYGHRYRDRPRFVHRHGHVYWGPHRGYRYYRPGYRRYGDFWFPPAAFIAGAILGGALAAPPPVRGGPYHYSPAHVEWCFARYRSYRASDNTFQPYHGPRRQCRSPYM